MNPTSADRHVNVPLTNISIAYFQSLSNFVASQVFPDIPVGKQSDRYWEYERGYFNRDDMEKRAPSTESAGMQYKVNADATYFADVWALHDDISDQDRANEDAPLDADADSTRILTLKAAIRRERLWVDRYFKAGVWGTDRVGNASPTGTQFLHWDDANSTPIADIRDARRAMAESTGFEANTLVLGRAVVDALRDHPDIIDRVKYGQTPGNPAHITHTDLAYLFEVPRVLVSNAIVNTADIGVTDAHSFIAGKHALLTHSATTPGLRVPSAGYTFSWKGLTGTNNLGHTIKKMRVELKEADRIEIQMAFDLKRVAADLGFFFQGAVT